MPLFQKFYTSAELQQLEAQRDVKGMLKALRNPDPDTRLNAAVALGRMGGGAAVEGLIESLENDPIGSVRYFAAVSLGQIGGQQAIAPLTAALLEPKHNIYQAAAQALGEIAARLKNPILLEAATKRLIPLLKANQNVREAVIVALGKIGDPRTTAALAAALETSFSKTEIRYLTEALIRLGRPAVQPLCQILMQGQDLNAIAAAFALGRIADPAATRSLIGALKHINDEVRCQAAIALGKLKAEQAVYALVETLEDNDAPVRVAVAHALGEIRAQEAIETLQSMSMYDLQASVRQAAEAALKKMGQ